MSELSERMDGEGRRHAVRESEAREDRKDRGECEANAGKMVMFSMLRNACEVQRGRWS